MEPGDSFQRESQHFNAISIVFNEVRQDEPCQSQRSASLTLSVYTCILLIHGVLCTQRAAHLFRSLTQGLKTLLPIFNSISIFLELRPCPCVRAGVRVQGVWRAGVRGCMSVRACTRARACELRRACVHAMCASVTNSV